MKITMLGHASYLIQDQETNVLMDPVFGNSFEEGDSRPFPPRTIFKKLLPNIDAVFLSHYHDDHFDISTLKEIGKCTPIYCPKSSFHILRLKKEGFREIFPILNFEPIALNKLEIIPTPSNSPVHREHGYVISDGEHYVWNQVDTVITPGILSEVHSKISSKFNLIFCPYQLLLEHALYWPQECKFPTERYRRLVDLTSSYNTELIIPGSSGLESTIPELNFGLFPINIDSFICDLQKKASFEIRKGLPGDCFLLSGSKNKYQSSELVHCENIGYKPHEFIPHNFRKYVDRTQSSFPLSQIVCDFMSKELEQSLKDCNHTMWKNIQSEDLQVSITLLSSNKKICYLVKDKKVFNFTEDVTEKDGWDINFTYLSEEVEMYLKNPELLMCPFIGHYKEEKGISILTLMGFKEDEVIDGWIGWNPVSAHRLGAEYRID